MPLPILGGTKVADTTFSVANSCRFNDGDSAYMTRAFDATQTSTSTFTISVWVKRGTLGTRQSIFAAYDGVSEAGDDLEFETDDTLSYNGSGSSSSKLNTTSAKFRDPSAWYHIVVARNSGASGAANQVKIYVNGVLQTLGTNGGCDTSQFLQNGLNSRIGSNQSGSQYYVDMYMAEFVAIDGQMLDHTSFGEFDSDSPTIWKPKNVSGLTFGNNGFYLDFGNSADLGADVSGNSNDFTSANLDATDQATDTPTNNFCTMNPLDNYLAGHTLSEGNLKVVSTASDWTGTLTATMGMSAGKWYWELFADTDSAVALYGIKSGVSHDDSNYLTETTSIGDIGYGIVTTSGNMGYPSGSSNSYGSALDADDVLMFALDMDNLQFYIGINGTWGNSGDPAGNSNGWTVTAPPSGFYFPGVTFNGSETIYFNFGSPPTGFTISSGNADGDGYGNFEYAPPSGFYALCTKNLGAYGG